MSRIDSFWIVHDYLSCFRPTPPKAPKKIPKETRVLGRVRVDEYEWMANKDDPVCNAPLRSPTFSGYMMCSQEANISFSPFLCWIRIFGITFRRKTRKRRAHIDTFLGTQLTTHAHSVNIGDFTDRMRIDHLTTLVDTRTSTSPQRRRRFIF